MDPFDIASSSRRHGSSVLANRSFHWYRRKCTVCKLLGTAELADMNFFRELVVRRHVKILKY